MKNPKAEFKADKPRVLKLQGILEDPDVDLALRTAFSQVAWDLPSTSTPQAAWNNACLIQGAKMLLEKLDELVSPARPEPKNINHPLKHDDIPAFPPTEPVPRG